MAEEVAGPVPSRPRLPVPVASEEDTEDSEEALLRLPPTASLRLIPSVRSAPVSVRVKRTPAPVPNREEATEEGKSQMQVNFFLFFSPLKTRF